MKIMYITSFPLERNTSATLRNLALIEGFRELGHDVSVVTFKPDFKIDGFDDTINILSNTESNIKIYRIDFNPIYSLLASNDFSKLKSLLKKTFINILRSVYHKFSVFDAYKSMAGLIKKIDFDEEYYDIVISSSDPKSSHVLGREFTKHFKGRYGKWIQYWGDPIYGDIMQNTFLPGYILKRIERNFLVQADYIIYVSPLTYEAQRKNYPEIAHKMIFVPVPYLKTKLYSTRKPNNIADVVLGYYGDYYSNGRNIMPLYNAAIKANFKLIIAGNSDVKLKGNNNVLVYPRLSYKEIERLESNTDILVCICNKKGTQIPGKIYHYAATNKPIIVILDGEKKELFKYLYKFDRFVLCDNNEEDIIKAVNDILAGKTKVKNEPCSYFKATNIAKLILENISITK